MSVSRKTTGLWFIGGVLLILLVCGGFLLLTPVGRVLLASAGHMAIRERATVAIADTAYSLEHSRVGIHPFVAEYSRDITFVKKGIPGRTTPISIDTCGGYPINCYLIESTRGPLVRLDDAVSEHLLDLRTETTYLVVREQGRAFVGELTNERPSTVCMMPNENLSDMSVEVDGAPATPMKRLTGGADEIYLGRIDGKSRNLRFIPAGRSPEVAIEHLFDG
jgi:hypothetical protein